MLNGDTFEISFLDLPEDPFGMVLFGNSNENFYVDKVFWKTNCCGCHKEDY